MSDIARGNDGSLIPISDFDYDSVDKNVFETDAADLSELSQEDIDRALKVMTVLLQWIFQNGSKNTDGLKIRSIIICWIFLKELRPMTLSDLARGFGMDKQSIGRWVDQFKRDFPIRGPHMRAFQLPKETP